MLPAWIIEEIKKREGDQRRRDDRPCVELPRPESPPSQRPSNPPCEDPDRERKEDGAGMVIDMS